MFSPSIFLQKHFSSTRYSLGGLFQMGLWVRLLVIIPHWRQYKNLLGLLNKNKFSEVKSPHIRTHTHTKEHFLSLFVCPVLSLRRKQSERKVHRTYFYKVNVIAIWLILDIIIYYYKKYQVCYYNAIIVNCD